MSTFYCSNINGGRRMVPYHHRTLGSPDGKLIKAEKSLVIIEGTTSVVSPGSATASLGGVNTLIPGVGGTQRAFILYIGAANRILPLLFEVTVLRPGVDDVFWFECVGDQLTTAQEKGDYSLALYFSHSTDSISFRQAGGDGTVGNAYTYNAIYGPASFRQGSLTI